ncbi:MAG: hypothetical protein IJS82_06150 [Paludibacteraceae bacterium]|nr:hypothetical protein [Paludibacteraceae bacterium]
MKKKFFWMALMALMLGLSSCKNETLNYPVMYIVNASDYSAKISCDNKLITTVAAHKNIQELMNTVSINLPVYIEVEFLDSKGNRVKRYTWENYYFGWNSTYKMTLQNSGCTLQKL